METKHISVLLHEAVDGLALTGRETYLDGTLGGGGHSREVLRNFPKVRVIALDQDAEAVERFLETPEGKSGNVTAKVANFRNLDQALSELEVKKVDAILLDLGFSTDQLEGAERGFSFLRDEPLDMRLSKTGFTAADILNSWDESAIELILKGFGEEKYARRIASAVVERRALKPFITTFDLVEVVRSAKPKSFRDKIHPATQTFQALRIAVNGELDALEEGLKKAWEALGEGGRLAVIAFHSLEDRIVKNFFRELAQAGGGKLVTKKPIVPSEAEIIKNPRSRSAKLRIIEKNEE